MSSRDHAGMAATVLERFPRWRRFWRCVYAAEAAQGRLPMMLWGSLIGAIVGALVALHDHPEVIRHGLVVSIPSSGEVLVGAAVGAPTGILVAFLLAFLSAGTSYRRHGDRTWKLVCDPIRESEDTMLFQLACTVTPPVPVASLGYMECVVKRPDGVVTTHAVSPGFYTSLPGMPDSTPAPGAWCFLNGVSGEYEVRWYGSAPKRRLYEIARKKFWIESPRPTPPLPPPAVPDSAPKSTERGS